MLVQFVFCTKMGKNEIEFKKQTSDIISIHDISLLQKYLSTLKAVSANVRETTLMVLLL